MSAVAAPECASGSAAGVRAVSSASVRGPPQAALRPKPPTARRVRERHGAAPTRFDAGVDQADVRFDQAAAARDRGVGDQARAARRQHFAGAVGDQRVVVGMNAERDVAALNTKTRRALPGDGRTDSGRALSSLRTIWRASPSAVAARASAISCLQRVELRRSPADNSAPTCSVAWCAKLCLKPSRATRPSR